MGYVRINLAYFLQDADKKYVMDALEFVCKYGWLLLPHYSMDKDSSVWKNRSGKEIESRHWLQ